MVLYHVIKRISHGLWLDMIFIQPQTLGDPVFKIEVFNRREYINNLNICSVMYIDNFQNLSMLIMYLFYIQKYIRDCENYFDRSDAELLQKWYYLVQDIFHWMNL